jgi:GNAT superfamily N-acetyltransferase
MTEAFRIQPISNPEESAWGIIGRGVGNYNQQTAGEDHFRRLCFGIHDQDGELAAGVLAEVYWNWLHIDLLWVREDLRRQGYGGQLLETIEKAAVDLGARSAYLDTFSFQAPDFYKKRGYRVFGELEDFPSGHNRFFLRKDF